jgi:queuine tRNA-ribosyltransferase
MTAGFGFRVLMTSGHARRSELVTPHGTAELPTFMPVGTQGSVKGLTPNEVASTGARIVLGNTYHLWMRPGPERIAALGGLHGFSRWPNAMLTDSGGFQAFSLAQGERGAPLAKTREDGVEFRSHLDGQKHFLSPEEAVRIQGLLGADIQMQLDVCPPGGAERSVVEEAVARTTRWAKRALACERPAGQALFGIIQGGTHADLRLRHAAELASLPFDGLALGGFSVGEPIAAMYETLEAIAHQVDPARPRYLMGVGTPEDLLIAIGHGVDMFDCVMPTRNARNGMAFTRFGRIVIKHARWRDDPMPLDESCPCETCRSGYSRAYLRHLYIAGEMLVLRLLSLHNLAFYGQLMREARDAIARGVYDAYRREALDRMREGSGHV